jgi:hypothetical protein
MTFPIDFWTHPKVSRLSDAAFRAFVEANGHSRMRESDGRIEAEDAEFNGPAESLAELVRSHPTRPLMVRDGADYVLRDYAEHQFTKADREELSEKRSRAGRASADKRRASAEHVLNTDQQTATEIGIGTGITTTPNGVDSPRKRAHSIPLNFAITQKMRDWASEHAPLVDVDAKLPEFIDYWRGVGRPMKDWEAVWHNGMRKQQGFAEKDQGKPRMAKADDNAAEYRRLYGADNERAGSIQALDSRIS